LAVTKQRLAGPRPAPTADGIVDLAHELGCLQIDPIRVVEHPHYLIPWSRIGNYERSELEKALWDERRLFHYWAHAASLVPTADYPIHQVMMRRYPAMTSVHHDRLIDFLEHNKTLRRHILLQLRKRGPLRTSDFKDLSVKNYESTGWNVDRNVDRMLDYLWTKGKIMIAGRAGQQRVWDLAERWLPEWTPKETLTIQQSTRRAVERSIRALGVGAAKDVWQYFTRWRYHDLPAVLAEFQSKKAIIPVTIDGLKDKWFAHTDDLEQLEALHQGAWEPRTTLLSPFDPLIADRKRLKKLWGFDYTIEIYVPKPKRKYGYYVLPILHGDTLIGRVDPTMDRTTGTLTINAIWAEPTAPKDKLTGTAVARSIEDLAKFLGATTVTYSKKVPAAWKPAFK
jgi:hypothetical protein